MSVQDLGAETFQYLCDEQVKEVTEYIDQITQNMEVESALQETSAKRQAVLRSLKAKNWDNGYRKATSAITAVPLDSIYTAFS